MTKYRVTFEIDEEVEADNRNEAVDEAIGNIVDGVWFDNELTQCIRYNATVQYTRYNPTVERVDDENSD